MLLRHESFPYKGTNPMIGDGREMPASNYLLTRWLATITELGNAQFWRR